MENKTMIKKVALLVIFLHLIISIVHGMAHKVLGIGLSPFQLAFVAAVVTIAPLLAAILLWKHHPGAGILLAISMAGSLAFGIWYHYVAISPDHISQVAAMPQKLHAAAFRATAFLLAAIEAIGAILGIHIALH